MYAHTGKVFIRTWGYGRYSFHMETGKLERLAMEDGKEYGDPMYAYTLAWPPEFLAPQDELSGDLHSHPSLFVPCLFMLFIFFRMII